jgi:adenylate cyclase
MSETRKLVAILVADVVGYCRLACADEDRTLAWHSGRCEAI